MSPTLFNLYVNDLPWVLKAANCDPVSLHTLQLNVLMYADDMLLLRKSEKGLQRALHVLEVYCKKWQLVVNTNKTQVMVLNKKVNCELKYTGVPLENVNEYTNLRVRVHKSGSFTTAIKKPLIQGKKSFL